MAGNGMKKTIGWLTLMVLLLGIVIGFFATLQASNRTDIKDIDAAASENSGDIKVLKETDIRFRADITRIIGKLDKILEKLP